MLLLDPFQSTAKYACFLSNTHFTIKVRADGYVFTMSSFVTPTPLSRTSSSHQPAPNCPPKGSLLLPRHVLRKTMSSHWRNTIYLLKIKASLKRKRKGCPANANWPWRWLSAARPKAVSFLPSHHGWADKNRASCAQCPLEERQKKKLGKEKILLSVSKEKHLFCTDTLACVEQRWTRSSEEGLQHTHVLAPGSLKASLFLLLPLAATPAYSKMTLHETCQLSSISTMYFLIPWPSYTIHHMLVFSRHYKNLRFAHQKAHLSAPSSPGELGMKCFLHFHRWEVHSRCWHAAWLGNQKQTSLPL